MLYCLVTSLCWLMAGFIANVRVMMRSMKFCKEYVDFQFSVEEVLMNIFNSEKVVFLCEVFSVEE